MTSRPWQPILDGDAQLAARAIAGEICSALLERTPSPHPAFKGDGGTVVLLAELGMPELGPRLEQLLLRTASAPMTIALFNGVSGAAWILDQYVEGPEAAAVFDRFESALWRHVDVPQWADRIDLISGLAGVGIMLAQRRTPQAHRIAERVVAHFEANAIATPEGVTWRNEPQFLPDADAAELTHGQIDLGVAHGVPGTIGMLAQLVEAGIEVDRSRALLGRAVDWLLSTVPDGSPRFGSYWPTADEGKRIGWCYGDTGIAGVLLAASRALDSAELTAVALHLLREAAAVLEERGAPDACFCHGAAGFAHVYNIAFQHTGDLAMRDLAQRWIQRTIAMRTPGRGIAGYMKLSIDGGAPHWVEDSTLLGGVAGIALVLLAAVSEQEPVWQRLFAL